MPLIAPNQSEPWGAIEIESIEFRPKKAGPFSISITNTALLKDITCRIDIRNLELSHFWTELENYSVESELEIEGLFLELQTHSHLYSIRCKRATFQPSTNAILLSGTTLETPSGARQFTKVLLRYRLQSNTLSLAAPSTPRRHFVLQ